MVFFIWASITTMLDTCTTTRQEHSSRHWVMPSSILPCDLLISIASYHPLWQHLGKKQTSTPSIVDDMIMQG